ncbi:MAG: hypothetical protein U9N06_05745 [candidate division WOR-3 bacterium]|nr:hypothetical protein [candidate division WOR-3 bacterium]
MKKIDIDNLQKIIKDSIKTIKELKSENEDLRREIEKERKKQKEALEELNKIEDKIKERF